MTAGMRLNIVFSDSIIWWEWVDALRLKTPNHSMGKFPPLAMAPIILFLEPWLDSGRARIPSPLDVDIICFLDNMLDQIVLHQQVVE